MRFIDAYLHVGNVYEAAIQIGCDPRTAQRQGYRYLHHPAAEAAIAEHLTQYQVTADRVLGELARIAFANVADYEDAMAEGSLSELTRDQAAGLVGWELDRDAKGSVRNAKVKLAKVEALDRLGKFLKLFTERVEVDVTGDLAARIEQARRSAGRSLPLDVRSPALSAPGSAALPGA